jgi:hypothetical protein
MFNNVFPKIVLFYEIMWKKEHGTAWEAADAKYNTAHAQWALDN